MYIICNYLIFETTNHPNVGINCKNVFMYLNNVCILYVITVYYETTKSPLCMYKL